MAESAPFASASSSPKIAGAASFAFAISCALSGGFPSGPAPNDENDSHADSAASASCSETPPLLSASITPMSSSWIGFTPGRPALAVLRPCRPALP